MGGGSRPVELHAIGVGAALARQPYDGRVAPYLRISFGPSQRDRLWLCGAEIYPAPNAAFKIYDGGDAIGSAYVAKLNLLGSRGISSCASARAVGCRATKIQWAGTLD